MYTHAHTHTGGGEGKCNAKMDTNKAFSNVMGNIKICTKLRGMWCYGGATEKIKIGA